MPSAIWSAPPPAAPQVELLKASIRLRAYSPPSPTTEPCGMGQPREFGPHLHTTGFLYLVNHGIEEDSVQRHLDIATTLLNLPKEEKIPYETTKEVSRLGRYAGVAPDLSRDIWLGEQQRGETRPNM
ncbi:uncharacterized protein PAC_14199 [Phialocephala subalpina]|uniref:Non-haem dioxygenase N-terminal domain-containing protein n=1 Tax=Phialocephala subalpina TaxID=576137 RepID=A0A1L7XH00_9HELO|nr:uncharacterized protein PAC_14199 [Phialocephala subalpina]